jgi:hypothetical protein
MRPMFSSWRRHGLPWLALLGLLLAAGACRKRDRLPATPYPKAKLAYQVGNCVYMDLNRAGEPEKGICYGNHDEKILVGDFDGNGTADLAVRRQEQLLVDTAGDGVGHEKTVILGWVGDATGFVVGDFTGAADRRGPALPCVARGDRCTVQGAPGGPGPVLAVPPGAEVFAGRWRADAPARMGVRTGLCVDLDSNGDGRLDQHLCYEDLGSIDQVLVGDWDGDGRDDLVLRRGACVFVDARLDGTHTESQCLGEGRGATAYFVGSWDGK